MSIGEMSTLDRTGDTKIKWDSDNPDEVAAARALFDTLAGKGFLAFKAKGPKGTQGEQIRAFDPLAEHIVMVPQLVGG